MINMLSATHPDGPAFNTRSRTVQQHLSNDSTPHTDATAPVVTETGNTTPKSLSADRMEEIRQTPFANVFQSNCQIEKHQNTRQISSYM